MERRSGHGVRREEDGNLAVALLLVPMLFVLCMALWALGRFDWSEAVAWGVVLLVLCRWLGNAEQEKEIKHG